MPRLRWRGVAHSPEEDRQRRHNFRSKSSRRKFASPTRKLKQQKLKSLSSDQTQPFHFPIEHYAVNNQHHGRDKGGDGAGPINRLAHGQIDPNAIAADPERKQGRKDDNNKVKTFDRHER